MRRTFEKLGIAVVAVASVVNLGLTITSDAQTGYDDVRASLQRIEARQMGVCP